MGNGHISPKVVVFVDSRMARRALAMNAVIGVGNGCGEARIERDFKTVYKEISTEDPKPLSVFEAMAAADPHHVWRAILQGPLDGAIYQRTGEGEWMLIRELGGIA